MQKILGIDPGSLCTGIGVISNNGSETRLIASLTIKSRAKDSLDERLLNIFNLLCQILDEYSPDIVVMEKIFHGINAKSSLVLGHVRGAIIVGVKLKKIDFYEYTPTQIKKSLTGLGRASKEQTAKMVNLFLKSKVNLSLDESDALSVAICHAFYRTWR